jgi:hypothetical protein
MKYALEMGTDAMIYISKIMVIGSGILKLMGGHRHTDSEVIS